MHLFRKLLKENNKIFIHTFFAILPTVFIVSIIFMISFCYSGFRHGKNELIIPLNAYIPFLICSLTLIIGSSLFQIGANISLKKIGAVIGNHIMQRNSILLLIIVTLLLGTLICVAEPDLAIFTKILGNNVSNNSELGSWICKLVAGVGVGAYLSVGAMTIILQKNIKWIYISGYFIIFCIACMFGPSDGSTYLSISFDSSGVTTGPATVPFVIAFGASIVSSRYNKNNNVSLGWCGIMSIGPIITMLLLCLTIKNNNIHITDFSNYSKIWIEQIHEGLFQEIILDVCLGTGPIFIFFMFYNLIFLRISKYQLFSVLIGFAYTFVGLFIFFASANLGLKYLGFELGQNICETDNFRYVLILIGAMTGIMIILGEPAVQILTNQIKNITNGSINNISLFIMLSLSVGLGIALEFMRNIYWHFSIFYYFIPIFLCTIILMSVSSDIFVAIAFDSGGVASGTIAVCFILPITMGISSKISNASPFGSIGMIATMPIICIEMFGLNSKIKINVSNYWMRKKIIRIETKFDDGQIIHFY